MAAEPGTIGIPTGEPSANGRLARAPSVCGASGIDERWLRATIERFEAPLIRYAMRITGDVDRGRDVVQETFLRLCREASVATGDHLAQWLFTVCRRLAIDVRRKETRMNTHREGTAVCDLPARAIMGGIEQVEQLDRVFELLVSLPANQQEVVRLKFQEGLPYKAIAEITGLSVSNVGYLLHTAVKTLREKMVHNE
jgi:RNA polymerase sigma factor (sigma-70 family)